MKVLLIGGNTSGSGGREHALAYLLEKSPAVKEFYCFGANAGIASLDKYRTFGTNHETIELAVNFAKIRKIDLTIVGPEAPLVDGIVDQFRAAGLSIFGPTKDAAQLEGSKWFAKGVMKAAGVPTAAAQYYRIGELPSILSGLATRSCRREFPLVIKADGLAAGKGAMVCHNLSQAVKAVCRCLIDKEFGPAGETMLIEEFLRPHSKLLRAELSVLALVDIHGNFLMLPAAQDNKPVFDGDKGDNTGGMGAIAPVPWVTPAMMKQIGETIFAPTIAEMKRRETPFSGVLYAGLMWTAEGPKVVEFNVRFGDPELQPLAIMLLKKDLIPILKNIADGGSIADVTLEFKPGAAVCLVLASEGYPGSYRKDLDIYGLDQMPVDPDFVVFHAGTRAQGSNTLPPRTNGGRVLGLTQYSPDGLEAGAARVQELAQGFSFGQYGKPGAGVHFRKDVGLGVPKSI